MGHVTSDPQVIADTLNQFFTDIGPNMANSITPSSHSSEKFLHFRNIKNSLFLPPSIPDELITIISSLKDKKAFRKYDYETKFIKLAKISIAEFLSKPVFPEALKIAKVVPIYKKGNVCEPTNYRPISLLSQFSKIFEKILFNRVIEYLKKFKLLSTRQYGFRKNSSTIHAIADIHNNLMTTADKRLYNCCLFLDL